MSELLNMSYYIAEKTRGDPKADFKENWREKTIIYFIKNRQ